MFQLLVKFKAGASALKRGVKRLEKMLEGVSASAATADSPEGGAHH